MMSRNLFSYGILAVGLIAAGLGISCGSGRNYDGEPSRGQSVDTTLEEKTEEKEVFNELVLEGYGSPFSEVDNIKFYIPSAIQEATGFSRGYIEDFSKFIALEIDNLRIEEDRKCYAHTTWRTGGFHNIWSPRAVDLGLTSGLTDSERIQKHKDRSDLYDSFIYWISASCNVDDQLFYGSNNEVGKVKFYYNLPDSQYLMNIRLKFLRPEEYTRDIFIDLVTTAYQEVDDYVDQMNISNPAVLDSLEKWSNFADYCGYHDITLLPYSEVGRDISIYKRGSQSSSSGDVYVSQRTESHQETRVVISAQDKEDSRLEERLEELEDRGYYRFSSNLACNPGSFRYVKLDFVRNVYLVNHSDTVKCTEALTSNELTERYGDDVILLRSRWSDLDNRTYMVVSMDFLAIENEAEVSKNSVYIYSSFNSSDGLERISDTNDDVYRYLGVNKPNFSDFSVTYASSRSLTLVYEVNDRFWNDRKLWLGDGWQDGEYKVLVGDIPSEPTRKVIDINQ